MCINDGCIIVSTIAEVWFISTVFKLTCTKEYIEKPEAEEQSKCKLHSVWGKERLICAIHCSWGRGGGECTIAHTTGIVAGAAAYPRTTLHRSALCVPVGGRSKAFFYQLDLP